MILIALSLLIVTSDVGHFRHIGLEAADTFGQGVLENFSSMDYSDIIDRRDKPGTAPCSGDEGEHDEHALWLAVVRARNRI